MWLKAPPVIEDVLRLLMAIVWIIETTYACAAGGLHVEHGLLSGGRGVCPCDAAASGDPKLSWQRGRHAT